MIKQIECDIFEAPIDVMIHGCNCFHTMGGGLAAEVKRRFPEAYKADCETLYGDRAKLGSYSHARVKEPVGQLNTIINLYSQFTIGRGRQTSYDAIDTGLQEIVANANGGTDTIGIPYMLGCGLGGGSWPVVEAIIYDVCKDYPGAILICKKV